MKLSASGPSFARWRPCPVVYCLKIVGTTALDLAVTPEALEDESENELTCYFWARAASFNKSAEWTSCSRLMTTTRSTLADLKSESSWFVHVRTCGGDLGSKGLGSGYAFTKSSSSFMSFELAVSLSLLRNYLMLTSWGTLFCEPLTAADWVKFKESEEIRLAGDCFENNVLNESIPIFFSISIFYNFKLSFGVGTTIVSARYLTKYWCLRRSKCCSKLVLEDFGSSDISLISTIDFKFDVSVTGFERLLPELFLQVCTSFLSSFIRLASSSMFFLGIQFLSVFAAFFWNF